MAVDVRVPAAWDGAALVAAFEAGTAHLERHAVEIDRLNVFPVPDGDTGSNMLATARAALEEARAIPLDARTVGRVAEAVSLGALMGARGNSGVILSQILRGMADSLHDAPMLDGPALARALHQGSRSADAAVATPVEGTILTVAREVASEAMRVAEADPSIEGVLLAALEAARASVARTPLLLPILRESGVVDAGGQGLFRMLEGLHSPLADTSVVQPEPRTWAAAAHGDAGEWAAAHADAEGYGYETVYLLTAGATPLDPARIRSDLERLGDSVLVAGDPRVVKVHVHNERPDAIIAYGLELGSLTRVTIENLTSQIEGVRQRAETASAPAVPETPAPTTVGPATAGRFAVVAVAAGRGLVEVLRDLGAHEVVCGTQGANPSAGELLQAIRATGAAHVLVLPNNPNINLSARQAAQLAQGQQVVVVPTRNAAEGVAALIALDPREDAEANAARMADRMRDVDTLQITEAVRDATIGGRAIRTGQVIALDPDEGLVAVGDDRVAVAVEGVRSFAPGFELLTLFCGEDAHSFEGEALARALGDAFPGVGVELVEGGQPHYSFLIAAE